SLVLPANETQPTARRRISLTTFSAPENELPSTVSLAPHESSPAACEPEVELPSDLGVPDPKIFGLFLTDDTKRQLLKLADTDEGKGQAFNRVFGDRFRYDHSQGCWLIWNDAYWQRDDKRQADRAAVETALARQEAALLESDTGRESAVQVGTKQRECPAA